MSDWQQAITCALYIVNSDCDTYIKIWENDKFNMSSRSWKQLANCMSKANIEKWHACNACSYIDYIKLRLKLIKCNFSDFVMWIKTCNSL